MFYMLCLCVALKTVHAEGTDDSVTTRKPFGVIMCDDLCANLGQCHSQKYIKEELGCYLTSSRGISTEPGATSNHLRAKMNETKRKHYRKKVSELNKPVTKKEKDRQTIASKADGYVTLIAGREPIRIKPHKEKLSWQDAQRVCMSEGGNLVKVDTKQKDNAIKKKLSDSKDFSRKLKMWIGATDRQTHGRFVWTDGSHVVYSNWLVSEPSHFTGNGKREECVILLRIMFLVFKWNDKMCDVKYGFICERH